MEENEKKKVQHLNTPMKIFLIGFIISFIAIFTGMFHPPLIPGVYSGYIYKIGWLISGVGIIIGIFRFSKHGNF